MKTLYTLIISLILCTVMVAQDVSVVADNVANKGSMYYFHGKKVARASDGLLMVIWTDIGGAGGQINFSIYDDAFDTWSPAAPISAAGDRADKPAIASDESGNLHACWQERPTSDDNYIIMYAKYDGTTWTTPVKVSLQDANECEESSIEVDSDGNIWIAYNNDGAGAPDEFVYSVTSTDGGTTWPATATPLSTSGLIDGSITNGRCTLTAGPDGKLVATWHNGQDWDSSRREIRVNQYDGTAWAGEILISDTTTSDRTANWYPTVAVDAEANIFVIYHTNDGSFDPDLRYMLCQSKTWDQTWDESVTTEIISQDVTDFLGTSAVADENGIIHLVFQMDIPEDTTAVDGNYYTYSKDGGVNWEAPMLVGREGYDGGYATLANRIRPEYGIDIAFRESNQLGVNDADSTAIIYANFPYSITTDIEEQDSQPVEFELKANYPNPFNPTTNISYTINTSGNVRLVIYDILGNKVKTLVNGEMQPGSYKVAWNGMNEFNKSVASGVYIASLEALGGRQAIKMQLLK